MNSKVLLQFILALLIAILTVLQAAGQNTSPFWSLAGNNNATTTSKFGTTNAIALRFITNNTDRLTITSGGNIGIGSTNPNGKLHINSPIGVSPLRVQTNGSDKFLMHMNGGLTIGSGLTPPSNGLYVAGRVGLSIAAPQALLHIPSKGSVSLSTTDNFLIGDTGSYNLAFDYNKIQARYGGGGLSLLLNPNGGAVGIGTEYADFAFATTIKPPQNGHGIMLMDSRDGYLLYGSKSGRGFGMRLLSHNVTNSSPTIYSYSAGAGAALYGEAEGQSANSYGSAVYGYNKWYGIGVKGHSPSGTGVWASSSYGNALYANTGSTAYAGYFAGYVYSSRYYEGSDQKLKQDIKDMGNAMEIIQQLRPKQYHFRQDGNFKYMRQPEGLQYGLIAQEVEKVLPNIVKESTFDPGFEIMNGAPDSGRVQPLNNSVKPEIIQFKALDYISLIPIMIKGMQEQQEENKALKEKLIQLEKVVEDLQNGNSKKTVTALGSLQQNTPNPARTSTTVGYNIPKSTSQAQLILTDNNGKTIRTVSLERSGAMQINTAALDSGVYYYSLILDGQVVDTKKMIIAR